ncbi:major facilitator superfamily [Zychaea mexicana]|uniref:major facilitator superfamily n=1 Tax=Zychaea mexicana TaxID=64656 RepID=UPI0022FE6EB1|nr:major facilitator superfamily [Zychaea mexicana]KAI9493771.1 major facilitator superfamily [Zychaea mexicana]
MYSLSIGSALPSIDVSIVLAIMTDMGSEFQRANLSTWIYSAYTLCALIMIPAVGGLSNAFNRKPILVINTCVFLMGSILCGFSQSFPQVIVARAVSGLGAGPTSLMSNMIIHDVVPKEQRTSYQSYISTVQTLAFSIGSPLGGFISDTIGWRYCFRINIPPLVLILYFYFFHLENYKAPNQQQEQKNGDLTLREKLARVDFGGIFLITAASFLFTSAFLLGGNILAWTHPFIVTALVVAPAIYGLFVIHQHRWAKHPMLPRTVSTNRNFVNACLCVGFSAASEASAVTIIPLFLMVGLHFTTAKSGVWLMIEAFSVPVGCFIAGRYIRSSGRFSWLLLFNRVLCAASFVILYFWIGSDVSMAAGTVGIVLQGMMFGFTVVILVIVASNTVSQELVPSALSIYMLSRSVSFLMGTSITSAIIQSVLKILLTEKVNGPDADQVTCYLFFFLLATK